MSGDLAHVHTKRSRGIENPGTVQMNRHPGGKGHRAGILHGRHRNDPAIGVGVFQADQRGFREMNILSDADAATNGLGIENAKTTLQRAQLHTGQDGGSTGFMPDDVTVIAKNHLIPAPAMGHQCQLVAHGAAWNEQGRFLAQTLGALALQRIHFRIITVDIIADRGAMHRVTHGWGRTGNGITANINPLAHRPLLAG